MNRPEEDDFLRRVKAAVRAVEPSAEVLLYGSRARGDANPLSDWDFLILLDGAVDRERERRARHQLYDVELATERLVSSIIRSREEWQGAKARWTPFRENVRREAVAL